MAFRMTYRSKGVHTNRKGGKTKRTAIDRTGAPFSPLPSTAKMSPTPEPPRDMLDVLGKPELRGTPSPDKLVAKKKPQRASKAQMAKAAAGALGGISKGMQEDQQRFSAEHDRAVEAGASMMARMQQSQPGKAADIIKRRRI